MKNICAVMILSGMLVCIGAAGASAQESGLKGVAKLAATGEGSNIYGLVELTETPEGLHIQADVFNVPSAGKHGFHIHQYGSCASAGKGAGGHFNPTGSKHGHWLKDGVEASHAGDMGNIVVDESGQGNLSITLPDVGLLNGKYNVAGRAIILHEKADDFGQPTGNAGSRSACATIAIVQ